MDDATLRSKLIELMRHVNTIKTPAAGTPEASLSSTWSSPERARSNIQDLLNSVSFRLKYVLFDLEATRRENALLRRIIADRRDHSQ